MTYFRKKQESKKKEGLLDPFTGKIRLITGVDQEPKPVTELLPSL